MPQSVGEMLDASIRASVNSAMAPSQAQAGSSGPLREVQVIKEVPR